MLPGASALLLVDGVMVKRCRRSHSSPAGGGLTSRRIRTGRVGPAFCRACRWLPQRSIATTSSPRAKVEGVPPVAAPQLRQRPPRLHQVWTHTGRRGRGWWGRACLIIQVPVIGIVDGVPHDVWAERPLDLPLPAQRSALPNVLEHKVGALGLVKGRSTPTTLRPGRGPSGCAG